MTPPEPVTGKRNRWQVFREKEVSKATQMALDLLEGRKGEMYRTTVKSYLKKQPSYFGQVLTSLETINEAYPHRLMEILSAEDS